MANLSALPDSLFEKLLLLAARAALPFGGSDLNPLHIYNYSLLITLSSSTLTSMAADQITYLVVGGCGFLGHHIVSQLCENHTGTVAVFDLRTDRNRLPGATYYEGDITSASDVDSVLGKVKPQVLIHTVSPLAMQHNKPLFDKVNIHGTENLIERAGKSGFVKAFVFTSSASVVHDGIHDLVNVDETTPVLYWPEQTEYYSHTKAVAESRVLEANRRYGDMLTCAIRPSGIYGEGDVQALPGFLKVLEEGKHNWQIGSNENQFDWTYVGNVAHAHILAARALLHTHTMSITPLNHEKVDGEAFFVTNDETAGFWDFPRQIWKTAGWNGSAEDAWVIPRGAGIVIALLLEWIYWIVFFGTKESIFTVQRVRFTTMYRSFDISKAKQRLGYMPIVSQKEGIDRGVKAYFKERKRTSMGSKEK